MIGYGRNSCGYDGCERIDNHVHYSASQPARTDWTYHAGRSWSGTVIEDACPCVKEACGLVGEPDPACEQHGLAHARTMRQGHYADECPARPEGEPQ